MIDPKNLISFDDIEAPPEGGRPGRTVDLSHLPATSRGHASTLPAGKEYTTLELAAPGDGHNASLLTVAAICFKMGVSFDDTLEHLEGLYDPSRADFTSAPKRAVARVWQVEGKLEEIIEGDDEGAGVKPLEELLLRFRRLPAAEIIERSPPKLKQQPMKMLRQLFKEGDVINFQRKATEHGTLCKLEEIPQRMKMAGTKLGDYHFLNPATFKSVEGVPNPEKPGKVMTRCNANVQKRDWMVIEFDYKDGDAEGEAKVERFSQFAMTMANYAPLVMAVDTGNKSIHFWFDGAEAAPEIRRAFFTHACMHGADKQLGVKSQIARMPNTGAAKVGRGVQRVIYFDPDREQAPGGWDLKGFEQHLVQAKNLDYFYHAEKYWTRDNNNRWVKLGKGSLKAHLARMGFRDTRLDGEPLSPADEIICEVELEKGLEAVLTGCGGHHAGFYEENGTRFLVLKSPVFPKARAGSWELIGKLLRGLFGQPDSIQYQIFMGWLSEGIINFYNDGKRCAKYTQAQMMHICGPKNCGKTLLLVDILTPLYGGRNCDARAIFKKQQTSEHNAELFNAELLFLDDTPELGDRYAERQAMGEKIKDCVVGAAGGGGYRGMQQDRINVRPWRRFLRLMNLEATTLATLPPLDEGVEDKLILLLAGGLDESEVDTSFKGWYERAQKQIAKEIPAFFHYLLHTWETPEAALDPEQRYHVASYHNPAILAECEEGSPESYIMHLIDGEAAGSLFGEDDFALDGEEPQQNQWEGSCDLLYDLLSTCGRPAMQRRFSKVCPTPKILLAQLRQLEERKGDEQEGRIIYSKRHTEMPDKRNGVFYWVILPPPSEQEKEWAALNLII
tara:strand:+ start:2552 stop:5080 length:2529 start_codon:yes stop_codon:yes gene_type:complete